MSADGLEVSIAGLPGLEKRLRWLGSPPIDELIKKVGQKGASQMRDRIRDSKRSPEGAPWQDWSPAYAKTRTAGQTMLRSSGRLLKSIEYDVVNDGAEIGSELPYAAAQQLGRKEKNLPARPFLGISDRNESAIARVVEKFFEKLGGE